MTPLDFSIDFLAPRCALPVLNSAGQVRGCGILATTERYVRGVSFRLPACFACAACYDAQTGDSVEPRPIPPCPVHVTDPEGNVRPCGETATTPRTVEGVAVHMCARCALAHDRALDATVLARVPRDERELAQARAAWLGSLIGIAAWSRTTVADVAARSGAPPYAKPGDGEEEVIAQMAADYDANPPPANDNGMDDGEEGREDEDHGQDGGP